MWFGQRHLQHYISIINIFFLNSTNHISNLPIEQNMGQFFICINICTVMSWACLAMGIFKLIFIPNSRNFLVIVGSTYLYRYLKYGQYYYYHTYIISILNLLSKLFKYLNIKIRNQKASRISQGHQANSYAKSDISGEIIFAQHQCQHLQFANRVEGLICQF